MFEKQSFQRERAGLRVQLRILETTDLHVHIMPYDYFNDRPAPHLGLARTASLIRKAREEVPNCLLFDNGDFLQGTPMSDWAVEKAGDMPHPMITAMNTLGYDGATLGNHEFNYGLGYLRSSISQADFPIVSANITTSQGASPQIDETLVPPWHIITRDVLANDGSTVPLKIGFIGFAPPQIPDWEYYTLHGQIGTRDILDAARAHIPDLKAAGAEIIIALSHSGIDGDTHIQGMENASVPLAAIDGIDVILTGHTHHVFPGPQLPSSRHVDANAGTLHGKPAVMAGFHGSHLGVIDLSLVRHQGAWTAEGHNTRAVPIVEPASESSPTRLVDMDAQVVSVVERAHQQVIDTIRQPLAETTEALFSYFSMVAPCALGTLLADALFEASEPHIYASALARAPRLAAVAPYRAGGRGRSDNYINIAAGPLAMRHAADIYPFPNKLCILSLTGSGIKSWLEVSARAFQTVTPGQGPQNLFDHTVPTYNFDAIHGLTYEIDLTRPVGQRIQNICLADGSTLGADQTVAIATNGYRAGGGGGFEAARVAEPIFADGDKIRDLLVTYLKNHRTVTPVATPTWRFAPIANASGLFETHQDAARYLHQLNDRSIRDTGQRRGDLAVFERGFAES